MPRSTDCIRIRTQLGCSCVAKHNCVRQVGRYYSQTKTPRDARSRVHRFRRIDSGQKLPFSQSCERHDGHQVRQSPAFRGGNARSIRATAQNKARCDYPPQRAKFLPDRNFDNIVKNVRGQRKGDVRRGAPPFRVELAGDYQIRTRSPGARYMPSPALTPNAS